MEVELKGQKFALKELKYLDVVELSELISDKRKHAIKLLELSGIPKEVTEDLTALEGADLMRKINELNGWTEGFQKTSMNEKR